MLTCGLLIQIAQDAVSEKQHSETEHSEVGFQPERSPLPSQAGSEIGELGEDQEAWYQLELFLIPVETMTVIPYMR